MREPYQAPSSVEEPNPSPLVRADGVVPALQYFRAFTYIKDHPKWGENFLQLALPLFVPIVGYMVFLGYIYEMVKGLHRGPDRENSEPYLRFNIRDFNEFLNKGIAATIVAMICAVILYIGLAIVALILTVPIAVTVFGIIFGITHWMGYELKPILDAAAPILVAPIMILSLPIASMLTRPMLLRAALTGKIGEAFNFGFIGRFTRKTWKEQYKASLFLTLLVPPIVTLGFLLCVFGLYPAITWIWHAYAHFDYQLYEIYLARGGEAIPGMD